MNECVALAEGLHNGISVLKLECLKVIMLKSWELFYGLLLLLETLISLAKWSFKNCDTLISPKRPAGEPNSVRAVCP